MRRPLVLALVLALSATGAWGDMYDDCVQDKALDRKIRGCTQVIERGKQESRENRAIAYFHRGFAYEGKGDNEQAIGDFTKAIALDPNDAKAHYNRGVVYAWKGELDRAIADSTKAIAINSNIAPAYALRGVAYESNGELGRAIGDYTKAIAINPNVALAYTIRGHAYEKTGDKEQAIADYRKALEIERDRPKSAATTTAQEDQTLENEYRILT